MRFAVAAILFAAAALGGCAAPRTSFAGIPFAGDAAYDDDVIVLARRASTGDRWALLELGIRYEEGKGVPVDLRRAANLYRRAAANSGGTTYVYVPPTRRGGSGYVTPINLGPVQRGLPEARDRLRALRERRRARESQRSL
jgi:hypothetical protein